MTAGTEPRLLERILTGDPAAQRAFFDRHSEAVRAYVRRSLARTEQDADEITVETFYRAFRGISTFVGRSSVRTWLLGIARRAAADSLRTRRMSGRPATVRAGSLEEEAEVERGVRDREGGADPLAGLLRTERCGRILDHLEGLEPAHREVIVLRLFTELSTRETAEVMGRSEDAVKMLLSRATARLARRIMADPYFRGGG